MEQRIVLRLQVRQPQAVVQGQAVVHLPVVLHVAFVGVVQEDAFDQDVLLRVGAEDAERGIGKAEAGIERVGGVPSETDVALG